MLSRTVRGAIVVASIVAVGLFAVVSTGAADAWTPSADDAWSSGYTLFVLDDGSDVQTARRLIQARGGRVALMFPPRILTGWSPVAEDANLLGHAGIRSIHRDLASLPVLPDRPSRAAVRFFERFSRGEIGRELEKAESPPQFPPGTDAFPPTDLSEFDVLRNLDGLGLGRIAKLSEGASITGNSDRMIGTVALSLFFIESDGSGADVDKFTWSPNAENDIFDEVAEALTWWSDQASTFSDCWVTFLIEARYATGDPRCSQWREPALRSSTEFGDAVRDVLAQFGYTTGSSLSRCAAYNLAQRAEKGTDWAFSAFIAANPTGSTAFTDGFAAWAYLGGPYVSLLQRSFNWSFKRVFAHESGHIFGACDEYHIDGYGGCSSCSECWTTGVDNGNCEACNDTPASCMMRSNSWALCDYTPGQLGWWRTPCSASELPAPILDSIAPEQMAQGSEGDVLLSGEFFNLGSQADLGDGVMALDLELQSSTSIRLRVAVDLEAAPGARDLVLTGPDGQSTTVEDAFTVRSTPIHYVSSAGSNSHPYTTPATAAHGLAEALAASSSGDTLRLVPGTYSPIAVRKSLVIEGGWSSAFVTRNPVALQSRIERIGSGPVVTIHGAGVSPVLDGLTLSGGVGDLVTTPELGSTRSGGGVLCLDASPLIRNCILEDNRAGTSGTPGAGGAVFLWNAEATFEDCIFRNNGSGRGAALFLLRSKANLQGNLFENNVILPYQNDPRGAALALYASEITMQGDILRMNHGAKEGGALYAEACPKILLDGVKILDHRVSGSGGAIWVRDSHLRLQASEILRNSAAQQGGGIFATDGALEIEASVLAGNVAGILAGGLWATGSAPVLRHVSLVSNDGGPASALYMSDLLADSHIENSIIAHNVGGGIVVGVGEPPSIDWNIYWDNDGTDLFGSNMGANDLQADPRLVDVEELDVHLAMHSPCIDSGSPGSLDPDGSASDRGAFGGAFAAASAPPRVDGLKVTQTTAGRRITWHPSTANDVERYLLFRGEQADFRPTPLNLIADIPSPTASFTDAPAATVSWYVVAAVSRRGYAGGYSEPVQMEAATDVGLPNRHRLELHPIFPNPTNPGAWIDFDLPRSAPVQIQVYNAQGRRMRRLSSGLRAAGSHRVFWDGRDDDGLPVSSGVYWVRMSSAGQGRVQKLTLVH